MAAVNFTTPVGRLVQGSVYEGQDKDAEGNALVYKTGADAGKPRKNFFFALAIPKGTERHWAETEWGAKIWAVGHGGFPNGAANSPSFAWKVTDGDSTIPNRRGTKPCDREGYRGHWVISFSSAFPARIYDKGADGKWVQITEPDRVKLGYYVQVNGDVDDNGSQQQPGVFINHSMVAFIAYGEVIYTGPDVDSAGFGNAALPAGATLTPPPASAMPAAGYAPPPVGGYAPPAQYSPPPPAVGAPPVQAPPAGGYAPSPAVSAPPPAQVAPPPPTVVTPNPAIMAPPAKQMTAKANGATYESFIQNGWTDAQLVQNGYMVA